jgi:hypothetical protein
MKFSFALLSLLTASASVNARTVRSVPVSLGIKREIERH